MCNLENKNKMKKIIQKLLDAKIMGASKLEIQRLQQQLDTQ
tara:strand:- start:668 stop:790 length:123 start_codon:yes stop_codon:yes gene_type:complete